MKGVYATFYSTEHCLKVVVVKGMVPRRVSLDSALGVVLYEVFLCNAYAFLLHAEIYPRVVLNLKICV